MLKMFKSKKALSPVVAAIILIAVTVAVSIAVAAWMGALTIGFMKTEELKITNNQWGGNSPYDNATLTVKNSGSNALTIDAVKVNSAPALLFKYRNPSGVGTYQLVTGGITLKAGETADIAVEISATAKFQSGTKYEITFHTAAGNNYPYTETAP